MNKDKNIETQKAILEKIKAYQKIVIARHIRPDGDAIGASHGLAHILRLSFPEKEIIVANSDKSDYMAFLETQETDPDGIDYTDALAIVVDTAGLDRCSNKNITAAKEIIKIDHHIATTHFGDLNWVEEDRSSVCEMVTSFQHTFHDTLKIDLRAATLLYTGMVTDSGRFKYPETTGDTLRLAGYLKDFGIDTQTLHAHLELEDFDYYKFKAYFYEKMNITKNGVAFLFVDKKMQEKFNLSREQASSCVDFMSKIKNCIIWLAFIENQDGTIRVRLRSRFITVNQLAEKYRGGGHANAAGATVYSKDELQALVNDADEMLGQYKANNRGWL